MNILLNESCRHEGTSSAMLAEMNPRVLSPNPSRWDSGGIHSPAANTSTCELGFCGAGGSALELALYKDRFHHHHLSVQGDEIKFGLSLWRIPGFNHNLWDTTQNEEWRNVVLISWRTSPGHGTGRCLSSSSSSSFSRPGWPLSSWDSQWGWTLCPTVGTGRAQQILAWFLWKELLEFSIPRRWKALGSRNPEEKKVEQEAPGYSGIFPFPCTPDSFWFFHSCVFMDGLDDPKGLFQPWWFWNCSAKKKTPKEFSALQLFQSAEFREEWWSVGLSNSILRLRNLPFERKLWAKWLFKSIYQEYWSGTTHHEHKAGDIWMMAKMSDFSKVFMDPSEFSQLSFPQNIIFSISHPQTRGSILFLETPSLPMHKLGD